MTPETQQVGATVSIGVDTIEKIRDILDKIENPSVIFCADHLQMALDAVEFCQFAAKKISALLPITDNYHDGD